MEKDITNRVLRVIRQIWKGGCVLPIFLFLVVSCVQRQDPDSLSEEEYAHAVENLVSVATSVESYFQESQSLDDMVARMDEIKAIEGVVDAYATATCFFVDIEGWGGIGYLFDKYNDTPVEYDPAILDEIVSMVPVRSGGDATPVTINGDYKACVMNAQHKERQWTRPVADAVIEMFRKCGIEADLYDDPKRSFFKKDIFDYNLVFIIGHGFFDDEKGLHWLETNDDFVITDDPNKGEFKEAWVTLVTPDQTVLIREQKIYEGEQGLSFRLYVSEKFISDSSHSFSDKGKAVLFMVPCQSLMCNPSNLYEDAHTYHHESNDHRVRLIDDNLAQTFFDKGAGLYIGYDESSSALAQFGGMHFFARLLSGYSFDQALNDLPTPENDMALRGVRRGYDPNATYAFQNSIKYNDDGSVNREWSVARHVLTNGFDLKAFVVSPVMEIDPQSGVESYQFSAIASSIPDVSLRFDDWWVDDFGNSVSDYMPFSFVSEDRPQYGFSIGRWPDPILGKRYPATVKRNPDTHRVDYQVEIPSGSLDANTEYHVWPYIANGDEYNYGNEMVFKTGEVIPSVPVPEVVDMGLSVKWASFNVGASKQEDCGSYFAWGETDPEKTSFSWTTYKWSGGVYQDEMTKYCTFASEGLDGFKDNKVTLEPVDDAARKIYGSNWRMPTKAEFEELIDPGKCIVKWDSMNGVPGLKVTSKKTGQFIFLPAAGGKSEGSMSGLNTFGRYWSSSLNEEGPYSAHYLYFKADNCYLYNYYRYYGYPVRAVYVE